MILFFIIIHVIVSIALILIVLLQTGKGAEMGAAFGGSSQTLFGGGGPAPFLGRVTTIAAIIFMVTSLSLAYLSSNPNRGSIVEDAGSVQQPVEAPAQNAQQAPAPIAQPSPAEQQGQ